MLEHLLEKHQSQLSNALKCTFHPSTCTRYFLTEEELKQHIVIVHDKSLKKCIYCKDVLANKRALQFHVNRFHRDVKTVCKIHGCSLFFLTQLECESHFEKFHQNEEEQKKFKCPKCSFKAHFKYILNKHKDRKHAAKDKQCPKCGKYFATRMLLREHLLKSHVALKTCQHCNAKLYSLSHHCMQRRCKNCHQVLMCARLAKLHICTAENKSSP